MTAHVRATRRRRCSNRDGCLTRRTGHDHGDCRHFGCSLADRLAMSYDGDIWLCESCYCTVRDAVDTALEAR
jgi:hypothetical protein